MQNTGKVRMINFLAPIAFYIDETVDFLNIFLISFRLHRNLIFHGEKYD